jgi:hypothetical protein
MRPSRRFRRRRCVLALLVAICLPGVAAAQRPLAVRIQWGGGQPRAWAGRIALRDMAAEADGAAGTVAPSPAPTDAAPTDPRDWRAIEWRTLSTEPDAAAAVQEDGRGLAIQQPRPVALDGVEMVIPDPERHRLVVELRPQPGDRPVAAIDVAVVDLLTTPEQVSLDAEGNRLTVRPAPGESLRVQVAASDAIGGVAAAESASVFRPGETIRCRVEPWLAARSERGGSAELRLRLKAQAAEATVTTRTAALVPLAVEPVDAAGRAGDRRPVTPFEPVVFDVELPSEEDVYDLEIEAVERAALGWSRTLATRTVQIVAIADAPAPAVFAEPPDAWRLVYELDPGSPKLHERLRRLPGTSLPSMALPAVPLQSLTRPGLQMPKLPGVPLPQMSLPSMNLPQMPRPSVSLPSVALPPMSMPAVPSMSSLVPRFSGLLATGHSRVEPHPLGPMLRLPAPPPAGPPTWEAVLLAGLQPGRPHAVEIDCLATQEGSLATSILELDAAGGSVQQRHAGGVVLEQPLVPPGEPHLIVHRFVFWPATKNPLLVIANHRAEGDMLFGRVRVLAGPERLPAATVAGSRSRRMHGFLAEPDFRGFGSPERQDGDRGRPLSDWQTHLTGIRRSAEYLQAHGAAGAMITVHARGAAAWPSPLTRQAGLWDCGGTAEHGLDPAPKDLLEAICRIYGRERLTLVPAVSFDGGLPALEAVLARGGDEAVGIACVGRDGRPRRTPLGCVHYNPLDPRVQEAVVAVVAELVGRVAGEAAIDQVAVLLGRDGWLHCPGVAWGLDDATFGRFLQETGAAAPVAHDGDRFAARAAAVEGPARGPWLAWRTRHMAALHQRLAEVVAAHDSRRTLAIVPTTLFHQDTLVTRFRPAPPTEHEASELLAEYGLDPAASGGDPRVVFVSTWIRTAAAAPRGLLAAVNRVAADGRSPARRGVLLLEEPQELDVRRILPHAPFGTAAVPDRCRVHLVAGGVAAERGLAESLAVADAERVFDSTIWFTAPVARPSGRAALTALPGAALGAVRGAPLPLVVRARRQADGLWVQVINPTAAPGRIVLGLDRESGDVMVVSDRTRLPLPPVAEAARRRAVDIDAWGLRTLWVADPAQIEAIGMAHDEEVHASVGARLERLRRQRLALESPQPLEALDNPGFDLGGETIAGWELLETRRAAVEPLSAAGRDGGRVAMFRSDKPLATLRSNPFPPPPSGRIGISAWVRLAAGQPQAPLRIALEGAADQGDFYRFAAVDGAGDGSGLSREWSQFVLHVDDLPAAGLDMVRVRFDLLGAGAVEIDDVRVYDLAIDAAQREQVAQIVARVEERLAAGDVASCLAELDGYWPRYLDAHLPEPVLAALAHPVVETPAAAEPDPRPTASRRFLRWW